MKKINHWINGKNVAGADYFHTTNPATGEVLAEVASGGADEVNQAVASWVEDNGYAFDGPAFNIYHVNPSETDDPEEYVTEVCYPVKKRA